MIAQSACQESAELLVSARVLATERLSRPNCPHCGSILLVAEESRFTAKGRIDHDWSCDECGHTFVTSVRVLPR